MPDIDTNPIPRDSLRDLIASSRKTPVTTQMEPFRLDQMLVHERTTEDIVVPLVKRKRELSPYLAIPVGFMAGILLGIVALVA